MAAHYPESEIVSVSNSHSQKAYIDAQAKLRGLSNLTVVTADINRFQPEGQFDRIVSVEMFEHVRNHGHLFLRLSEWLEPEGKIFLHVFANRKHCYLFEPRSSKDWMSKYFFTGGIMPSADLLPTRSSRHNQTEDARWKSMASTTTRHWKHGSMLQDANEDEVLKLFRDCYGKQAKVWLQRWRIFYMACSELFAYRGGGTGGASCTTVSANPSNNSMQSDSPLKIAVVGCGVAGLTAAWLLSRKHEVHLFEKNNYPGFTRVPRHQRRSDAGTGSRHRVHRYEPSELSTVH